MVVTVCSPVGMLQDASPLSKLTVPREPPVSVLGAAMSEGGGQVQREHLTTEKMAPLQPPLDQAPTPGPALERDDRPATRRMTHTTRSRSSSVRFEPEGRQRPFSKSCSATLPPTTGCSAKTGCRCMGFHTGLDSILASSRASRTSSRVAPNSLGSIWMQVSQKVDRQPG